MGAALSVLIYLDFWAPPPPPAGNGLLGDGSKQLVARLDSWQSEQLASGKSRPRARAAAAARVWLNATDGAVWWAVPEAGPQRWATVGQLTVPSGSEWRLVLNAQGRRPFWISDGTTIGVCLSLLRICCAPAACADGEA